MRVGLAGYPIDHSLSPCIHSAAYQELGLDWSYGLFPCANESDFTRLIETVRAGEEDICALNVTTPYKLQALQLCDNRDQESMVIGGANVLALIGPGNLISHNTDGRAALRSLCDLGFEPSGAEVVICGTGPVAAAILLALVQAKTAGVHILSRDENKAEQFVRRFELKYQHVVLSQPAREDDVESDNLDISVKMKVPASHESETRISVIDKGQLAAVVQQAKVLIDATPLGMQPGDPSVVPIELLHPALTVMDTVYGHGETALLAGARAAGSQALDGLAMLVEQAALSIEHWGVDLKVGSVVAPRETMMAAALAELKTRST